MLGYLNNFFTCWILQGLFFLKPCCASLNRVGFEVTMDQGICILSAQEFCVPGIEVRDMGHRWQKGKGD